MGIARPLSIRATADLSRAHAFGHVRLRQLGAGAGLDEFAILCLDLEASQRGTLNLCNIIKSAIFLEYPCFYVTYT